MDNLKQPETDAKDGPRRRVGRMALGVLSALVGLGLVIVADTMDLGGFSRVIDRVGVLPICVYDHGCQPCYGRSCLALPRSTPGPCFGKTGQALADCNIQSLNWAQLPVRDCHRFLGFRCMELQTGPE